LGAARHPLFHPPIVRRAIREAFYKLSPRHMRRNPVMFVVLVGSILTSLLVVRDIIVHVPGVGFTLQLAVWLWFTVLFANFAEAMAEGRGKAQADVLHAARVETRAKRLHDPTDHLDFLSVFATDLRRGDHVIVKAGDLVPADGEVIEGIAAVDESAVTGESAPVIREAGAERSAVTGGTRLVSDWLVIRVTANPGETFVDRIIALVEGASRRKTPNEVALTILLSGLTIVFLWTVTMLRPFAAYRGGEARCARAGRPSGLPHTDDYRWLAFGHRHCRHGPPDPAQRDRPEWAGCRGRGRRGYSAAGQDRHDHPGEPTSGRVPASPGGRH
jgi:K+-transporting ATPase ATPase B chain